MTNKQKILLNLLKTKGIEAVGIWFNPTFGYQPGGWWFEDSEGNESILGRNYKEAFEKIQTIDNPKVPYMGLGLETLKQSETT